MPTSRISSPFGSSAVPLSLSVLFPVKSGSLSSLSSKNSLTESSFYNDIISALDNV
jgi:hypothetical protein